MFVITVTSQKGGNSKTTTAGVLAAYLSKQGKKTLVIDLNDQADLTDTLGAEAITSGAAAVLQGQPIAGTVTATNLPNVDILTGAEDLGTVEMTVKLKGKPRSLILREALKPVRQEYDYVVIDSPGTFNTALLNALAVTDSAIIVANADVYNLKAIRRVVQNIDYVKANIKPGIKIAGILLTRYNARRTLTKEVIDLLQEAENSLKVRLFNAKIRETVKIQEAPAEHKTIIDYAPGSNGAIDYNEFLKEYFTLLEGDKDHEEK